MGLKKRLEQQFPHEIRFTEMKTLYKPDTSVQKDRPIPGAEVAILCMELLENRDPHNVKKFINYIQEIAYLNPDADVELVQTFIDLGSRVHYMKPDFAFIYAERYLSDVNAFRSILGKIQTPTPYPPPKL